jgi:hypothetical protein
MQAHFPGGTYPARRAVSMSRLLPIVMICGLTHNRDLVGGEEAAGAKALAVNIDDDDDDDDDDARAGFIWHAWMSDSCVHEFK